MALAPVGHQPDWPALEIRLLVGYIQGRFTLEDLELLLGPRLVRVPIQ